MKTKANKPAKSNIAKMAIVGVLSAIAYLLMFMEFSVPLMPVFIKMDLSDFPALIGSLAVGPAGGIIIALIKNLLHLTHIYRWSRRTVKFYSECSIYPAGRIII